MNNDYFIPNDPRPMPDELMYSYLVRLAQANLIPVSDFVRAFVFDNSRENVPAAISRLPYGNTWYIGALANFLGCDSLDFFLDMSIYSGISPLMIPTVQYKWINNVFRGNHVYPHLINEIKTEIKELKYCPVCMAQEMSTCGFCWLHRKHHMPGVTACDVHNVSLVSIPNNIAEKGSLDFPIEESTAATEMDIRYAVFAHEFLDARISSNWWSIRDILLSSLNNSINTPENEVLLDGNPEKVLRSMLRRNPRIDPAKVLKALFVIFGDVTRIPRCENNEIKADFFSSLDGYILESPYSETAVKMRKEGESETFVTTPQGFLAGWRSLSEDIVSEDEKYQIIVENTTKGLYIPDEPFNSLKKRTFFIHRECGTKFEAVPSYLLEGITNCPCLKTNGLADAEVRSVVEGSGHYKLIEFTGTEHPLIIKCNDCGHTFEVRWKTWKKQEGCRVCMHEKVEKLLLSYSTARWNSESEEEYDSRSVFEKRMRDLTGDEYVIIGVYTDLMTPVQMLHKKCGNVFPVIPNYFLHGGRCPVCGYPHDTEFLRYIEVRSNGRYECLERSGMHYTLRDTITGRTVTLRKLIIIQEFERLTPSEILPLEEKGEYIFRKTNMDQVSDFIFASYGNGIWFTKKDISIPLLTDKQIYETLKKLVRKGILTKDGKNYMLNRKDI